MDKKIERKNIHAFQKTIVGIKVICKLSINILPNLLKRVFLSSKETSLTIRQKIFNT